MPYRQIAPPPSDKTAALILICSVIERHVGRLEELLAEHEQIEAAEADQRYDRAALDCSPAFERHRRYQSARHRELLGTLEAFRKMRKEEFGTENGEAEKADGKCQVADDKGQMADNGCRMGDDRGQMADDGCRTGDDRGQMADDGCRTGDDRGQMADDGCRTGDDRGQMADDGCRIADDGCEVRSGGCGDGESGQPMPQAPSDEMSQEDRDYVYGPSRPGSRATMIAGMSGGCGEGEPETVVVASGSGQ